MTTAMTQSFVNVIICLFSTHMKMNSVWFIVSWRWLRYYGSVARYVYDLSPLHSDTYFMWPSVVWWKKALVGPTRLVDSWWFMAPKEVASSKLEYRLFTLTSHASDTDGPLETSEKWCRWLMNFAATTLMSFFPKWVKCKRKDLLKLLYSVSMQRPPHLVFKNTSFIFLQKAVNRAQ